MNWKNIKTWLCLLLVWLTAVTLPAASARSEEDITPRDRMIEDILAAAKAEYDAANGKLKRAHYAGDIYVCKNFTVYCFKQAASKYRMAEFPEVKLVIPDNLPAKQCKDPAYGALWKEIAASDGNPFYAVETFKYDKSLSKAENRERAREFLKQAKKGDFFQMRANYYYGIGAHSMMFSADYDSETDTVTWCDSNMKGQKKNGIRYALMQWDAVKEIDWFVDAFCRPKYGATIYRLRDDIILAD